LSDSSVAHPLEADPPLLKNRNFVLLYSGKLVSLLGDQIYLIALSWYILSATHSPIAAGLLFMMGALPSVLIGPFTGVLADWFERRTILIPKDQSKGSARKTLLRGWLAAAIANTCFAVPVFPPLLHYLTVNQISAYAFVFSIFLGFGLVSINIPVSVIVQRRVEDRFRGRVWAFLGSLSGAAMPLAYLTGGLLARVIPLFVIYLCGGLAFFCLLLILTRLTDLREV
jgi:MFS family permease